MLLMPLVDAIIQFLQENPVGAGQLLLSGALVGVTVAYTYYTRSQIREMQDNRKTRNKPIIKPTIENRYAVHYFFAIENTGNGAAYNVSAKWWINDEETAQKWSIPILSSGERRVFPLPVGDDVSTQGEIEDVLDKGEMIDFRVSYDDGLGNSYSPETTPDECVEAVDVLETIVSRADASEYVDKDPLSEIASEMDDLTSHIDSINNSIQLDHLNDRAKQEMHERILEELQSEGPLTFRELKGRLGIDSNLLNILLINQKQGGEVDYDDEVYSFQNSQGEDIEYVGE